MIVSSSTRKPQNVAACAAPGTVHFSSLRCPITSVSWVSASRPGCDLAYASRSGAGWPLNASRLSHHSRLPAIAHAAAVSTRPTIMRKTMDAPHLYLVPSLQRSTEVNSGIRVHGLAHDRRPGADGGGV